MTVCIDQSVSDSQVENKNHTDTTNELILDGEFVVPDTVDNGDFDCPEVNAFGQTFRDYDAETERQKQVEECYRLNHIHQTYEYVKKMRDEYKKLDKLDMSIWECCELLNEVVDESDPDLDDPQIEHLLQTAEAIRKDYPNEDWLHLTALIHGIHTCFIYIHVRKIQSALMTTAYNTYKNGKELLDVSTGKPATPFDIGAGHVDPVSALNPGLVYNASKEDYLNFLCALNYSSTEIKALYDKSFECVDGKSYRAEDLNYPSFEVPLSTTSGQTVIKYTRTLTNVGTPATYKVLASSKTHAVKIVVEPEELTFIKENEKKAYTVTFTATSMPPGTTSFGRLAWSGGKYVVSSPIAFTWD